MAFRILAGLLLALVAAVAQAEPTTGPASILLVASRQLQDPNFRESVVLVTQHGRGGPLGLIINRPTPVPLARLFADLEQPALREEKLHFGGPVGRNTLVFMFRATQAPPKSVAILDGIYMSLDRDLLRELLKRDKPMEGLRVYAGYAGWAPGQLEREVARGDWHLSPARVELLFDRPAGSLWQHLQQRATARPVRFDRPD